MSSIHLSIIIPAYNEETRLPATLEAIEGYLNSKSFPAEILIIDDGSKDGTLGVVEAFKHRLPLQLLVNKQNRGKGFSIRRGMIEAQGAWRLFSDADLSTPIEDLEKFWPATKEGFEVVIGSRALPESEIQIRQSWHRELMGRCFNMIIRCLGLSGIRDTQCGFKLFSARAANQIFPKIQLEGFAFDVDVLLRAQRAELKIKEIPVKWINSPDSRVNILRDSLRMLKDVIRLRFRS